MRQIEESFSRPSFLLLWGFLCSGNTAVTATLASAAPRAALSGASIRPHINLDDDDLVIRRLKDSSSRTNTNTAASANFSSASSSVNLASNMATLHLHSKENSPLPGFDDLPSAFFSSDFDDVEEPPVQSTASLSPTRRKGGGGVVLRTQKAPDYSSARAVNNRPAFETGNAVDQVRMAPGLHAIELGNTAVQNRNPPASNALNNSNNRKCISESRPLNQSEPSFLPYPPPPPPHKQQQQQLQRQQQQQQQQQTIPSTPPRKPMTAPLRSVVELRQEKARLSEQICDLLDAEDDHSLKLLKELRERRKEIEAEINKAPTDPVAIGETQFTAPFIHEPLQTIPETPLHPSQQQHSINSNILDTPNVISITTINHHLANTSFLSTPGPTQLTQPDPAHERWTKTDFPWSRDIKKALNL